jgi:hypothetical protein
MGAEAPMPIIENDPWRRQYFEDVPCPEDVVIPTDDPDCYELYPRYRWVYNKLSIAESQGLECAPHGVRPKQYPVFSKPIYNLKGMGSGSRVLASLEEYEREQRPGHFWMPLLGGEHVSTDVAVVNGEPAWWRHTIGSPLPEGMFDYWTVLAEVRPDLELSVGGWLRRNLAGFTGIVNVETISGSIIECHLRMADQWVDLNGPGWVASVVELYRDLHWKFPDPDRRTGYSVVLFGGHGPRYQHVDPSIVDALRKIPGVSSIQITFHADKPPEFHAMPPGGFRLAIVNAWNLEVGFCVREELALHFWSTQTLHPSHGPGGFFRETHG